MKPTFTAQQICDLFDYTGAELSPRQGVKARRRLQVRGYIEIVMGQYHYAEHRLIWLWMTGEHPTGEVDHINGDRSDNRFENLRDVTRNGNQQNRRAAQSNNKSGLLGAAFHKRTGRYQASIWTNGKCKWLGLFDTPQEAHDAYLAAKRELHSTCSI